MFLFCLNKIVSFRGQTGSPEHSYYSDSSSDRPRMGVGGLGQGWLSPSPQGSLRQDLSAAGTLAARKGRLPTSPPGLLTWP